MWTKNGWPGSRVCWELSFCMLHVFSALCSSVATHYLTVVAYQCLPVLPVDLELLHSHAGGCQEGQEQIRMGAGAVQW